MNILHSIQFHSSMWPKAPVCLDHDITEGILHPNLSESILCFINKKFFTLENLNDRMCSIKYGEVEQGNLAIKIDMKNLTNGKLRTTVSELFFFAHYFTIMVGHSVPDNDPVWQHVLTKIKLMDLCYQSSELRSPRYCCFTGWKWKSKKSDERFISSNTYP